MNEARGNIDSLRTLLPHGECAGKHARARGFPVDESRERQPEAKKDKNPSFPLPNKALAAIVLVYSPAAFMSDSEKVTAVKRLLPIGPSVTPAPLSPLALSPPIPNLARRTHRSVFHYRAPSRVLLPPQSGSSHRSSPRWEASDRYGLCRR